VAVPEGGNAARLAFSGENLLRGGENFSGVRAYKQVCTFGNGDGTLGVFAKRQARDA
jgi:hypothetical protein